MTNTEPTRHRQHPEDARTPHHRHLGWALAIISAAQLMVMLDVTIVNVALPSIQRALSFSSTANLEWVITAYVVTFGGLLLLGGRSGDLYGRRRMFVAGILLFSVSSLAGGLATDQTWLIAARAIQGVGAAIASPTALSLVTATFPEGRPRHRAMAVYAAMSGAGGALGLLIGGALTEFASWRWVLFVNVPIGLAVVLGAVLVLDPAPGRRGRLDIRGALLATAGAASLVYGLAHAADYGFGSTTTLVAMAAAAVLLAGFVAVEATTATPLLPLGMLRNRNRAGGYAAMLLLGGAMLALIFFVTQFLQDVKGYSPLLTGVAFLPVPVMVATVSQVASRLVGRIGTRPLLTVGPLVTAAGLLWLSNISATDSYLALFGPLVLAGLGMGLSFVPLTLNAVSSVSHERTGLASALLTTSQQIGGSLGIAILVTVASHASAGRTAAPQHAPATAAAHALLVRELVNGYDSAFRTGALLAALAFLAALLTVRGRVSATPGDQQAQGAVPTVAGAARAQNELAAAVPSAGRAGLD